MPQFADFETKSSANIFKAQGIAVLVAPYTAAAATPATLFDTTGALIKPTGFQAVGYISTDGLSQEREQEINDTFGFGAPEPIVRTPIRSPKSFTFTALELNKTVDQLYYSMMLTGVSASTTTNVVNFKEPDLPALLDWRVLAVAVMRKAAGEWYEAVQYVRGSVNSTGGQVWDQGENGAARGLQVTAQRDDVLGYAAELFKGGPGFNKTAAGYAA